VDIEREKLASLIHCLPIGLSLFLFIREN